MKNYFSFWIAHLVRKVTGYITTTELQRQKESINKNVKETDKKYFLSKDNIV